jgi:hypothetical protein
MIMDSLSINIIIGLAGAILAIVTFVFGRTTASREDGKQDGTILSELGYLKSSTDDIKRRLDKQDERDRDYISRLTCVEESTKQAHRRIDGLEAHRG